MLTSGNAPFKMSVEIHPDGPRMVLDPEPKSREQKELALEFLQTVAANLHFANAQLNQQLIAAQSTNAIEKRLREEKEEELLLSQERERTLLKLINDTASELSGVKEHVDKLQIQIDQLLRRDAKVTLRESPRKAPMLASRWLQNKRKEELLQLFKGEQQPRNVCQSRGKPPTARFYFFNKLHRPPEGRGPCCCSSGP